ncbi:hypothetical protein PENSOL_c137G00940 [Penicillium solitum]|uniref:BZIP domain-containing protein n=1 Tax=Penicillium solitum TaxID=60172 RepID=A0A1V6Q545_9EURO|nr:uncharacterized protein PENSOL_c137G00940 [Penicillium solitum]OQD83906.1 hypothetical protein PENSOL_c137G00940 [Penicillium solitum]
MSRFHDHAKSSRGVPKSWSSGRILTEPQRQQKRNRDRITKERHRNEERKEKEDLKLRSSALEQDVHYLREVLAFSSLQSGPCKCIVSGQRAQGIECGLAVCCTPTNDQSYTLKNFSDQLLRQVHHLTPSQVCLNEPVNQDALIRGILFGWDKVQNGGFWCPLWEIIYQIDTVVFVRSRLLTRICMLRMIHLLLQCFVQTHDFRNIPAWYRPRPSQIIFHHDISADYIAWPGLRERLALTGSRMLTDEFFSYLASGFRFIWKRQISDVYELDAITGLCTLSSLFNESLWDIRNWAMDKEFFEVFPQVYYDFTLSI